MPTFRIDDGSIRYAEANAGAGANAEAAADIPVRVNRVCSNPSCRDCHPEGRTTISEESSEESISRLVQALNSGPGGLAPGADIPYQPMYTTETFAGNSSSEFVQFDEASIQPQPQPQESASYRGVIRRQQEQRETVSATAADSVIASAPTPSSHDAFGGNLHDLAERMLTEANSRPRGGGAKQGRVRSLRKTLADAYLLGVGRGYSKAAPVVEYGKMWTRLRAWGERELRHLAEAQEAGEGDSSGQITEVKAMLLRMEMMENEG